MKKILFALFFILYALLLSSQSFHKNALVFDVKGAIDVYDTKYYYALKNYDVDTLVEGKAANANYALGLEYGILNKLGLGIRYKHDKYFVEQDATTKKYPSVTSNDVMVMVNYHVLNKKVFNLVTGINIGYTHLNFISNNISDDQVYGNGMYFDVHVSPRIWIGRFGFQWDISVPFVNYNKLTSNNETVNNEVLARWKGVGYSIGMGIQFRFLKDPPKESKTSLNQ